MTSTALPLDSPSIQSIKDKLSDQWWRLSNLYYITDKNGTKVKFKPNWAQKTLFENCWYLNVILKARQLGMTTLIQLYLLDCCLFNSNIRAGVIAHNKDDAQVFFRDKIKFAYDNLPDWLKTLVSAETNRAGELLFSNNSSIRVGTSMRSGTFQYLHVSEFGKICAKYPDKAKEVVTGAFNTVQAGQFIFIESTAEGRESYFYDYCRDAQALQQEGRKLTPLDYRFHFFPWYRDPSYRINPEGVVFTQESNDYFNALDVDLTIEQKAWYVKKAASQGENMMREYPTAPKEAFEQSLEGAYYARQMTAVRAEKRIRRIPYDPRLAVHVFFDLGRNDSTAIWFMQTPNDMEYRFIRYYENSGESLQFYLQKLQTFGYVYGVAFLPHDAEVIELTRSDNKSRKDIVKSAGFKVKVVSRVPEKLEAIQAVRNILPLCWFDEEHCAQGIKCLDSFRKEWDDKHGVWKDRPRHDWASHGNDAFEQFARGFKTQKKKPPFRVARHRIKDRMVGY